MSALDTSPDAEAVQTEIHRRLSHLARFDLAVEMSEFVRECARGRIRAAHPEFTPAQVTASLIRELYGVIVATP